MLFRSKNVPRAHLIGTLVTVLLITLGLSAFFTGQQVMERRAGLARIQQDAVERILLRLRGEMEGAISYIDYTRTQTETVLRRNLVEQVNGAYQVAEAIHAHAQSGPKTVDAKRLVVEALRPVRFFDGRGYFFIDDMTGQFILLPTAPQLEGQRRLDNRDDKGTYIMRGLIDAARKPEGEGFFRYRWYSPENPKEMAEKLSYVRYFAPYDWLIGAGDYLYKWDLQQRQEALARLRALRYAKNGYFVVIDREGRVLLSPGEAAWEGKKIGELPERVNSGLKAMYEAGLKGQDVVHYTW